MVSSIVDTTNTFQYVNKMLPVLPWTLPIWKRGMVRNASAGTSREVCALGWSKGSTSRCLTYTKHASMGKWKFWMPLGDGHPQVLLQKLSSRPCSCRLAQSSLSRSHTFRTPRTSAEFSRLEIFSPVGVVHVLHPIFTWPKHVEDPARKLS